MKEDIPISDEDIEKIVGGTADAMCVSFDETIIWVREDIDRIVEAVNRLQLAVGGDSELASSYTNLAIAGSYLHHTADVIEKICWSVDKINEFWEE